jgi:sec-independent protein translocase protein TatA
MGEFSAWHWLIVIAALVLLFGASKLPQMARAMGQSVRILRAETRAAHDESQGTTPSEQSALERDEPAPDGETEPKREQT